MDFTNIEKKLSILINDLTSKLDSNIIDSIIESIKSGEYGVALEELSNMIFEYDVKISSSQFNSIKDIGTTMKLDSDVWNMLETLIV